MSELKDENFQSVSIGKSDNTDTSIKDNTDNNNNQNENSIDPSQEINIPNHETTDGVINYTKSYRMNKKKKNYHWFNYWRNYFNCYYYYSCNCFET